MSSDHLEEQLVGVDDLREKIGIVDIAAISGDGVRCLTVIGEGNAHVWETRTGRWLARIAPESPLEESMPGFRVFVESAALDRDGNHALLGLNDGSAVIHRVGDGSCMAVLRPLEEGPPAKVQIVRAVGYSADGNLALVGFPGRRVGVWSADGQRLVAMLPSKSGPRKFTTRLVLQDTRITSVAISSDHRTLFAGASDDTVAVFDLDSQSVVFEAIDHTEQLLELFDTEAGVGWATTAGNVWLSREGGSVRKAFDADEPWSEVVFDGERLLARARKGTVTAWTLAGQRQELVGPRDARRENWTDSARTLGLDGSRIHYPESRRRLAVFRGDRGTILQRDEPMEIVGTSPRGDLIAVAGGKDELELWDPAGKHVRSLGCPGGVGSFDFSPNGSLVAVGELGHERGLYPRHVYICDVDTGELRWRLKEHEYQVRSIAFSPDGTQLASLADELVVWRLADLGDRLEDLGAPPSLRLPLTRPTGAFRWVGRELLVLDEGRARVFVGAEERLSFEVPIDRWTPWTLSQDQRFLLVGGVQEALRFDLATGQLDRRFQALQRPEPLPPRSLARRHAMKGRALLWRTPHGTFLHQGERPRGWMVEYLELSAEGLVVVPCAAGAAVLRVTDGERRMLGTVHFNGSLRATRVLGDRIVLVNSRGMVFHSVMPSTSEG